MMKKYIIILCCIVFAFCQCSSVKKDKKQNKSRDYVINGTIKGNRGDKIYLVRQRRNEFDTINSAEIKNGKFQMQGQVGECEKLQFTIPRERYSYLALFLEPGETKVTINENTHCNWAEGGQNQKVENEYIKYGEDFKRRIGPLWKPMRDAEAAGDENTERKYYKQIKELKDEYSRVHIEFMKKYNNSIASLLRFKNVSRDLSYQDAIKVFDNFSTELKECKFGKYMAKVLKVRSNLKVGDIIPDFTLETPNGNKKAIYDVKAKIKIIDFWASWCKPCRFENKNLKRIYEKFHHKGVDIISISIDRNKIQWKKAVEEENCAWTQLSDFSPIMKQLSKTYSLNYVPQIYVVDENNKILAKNIKQQQLKFKIEELLSE